MDISSNTRQGFSMVEIIVSASIFLTVVVGFVAAFDAFTKLTQHTAEQTAASLLLEEGAEAVLLLRDLGWAENIGSLALEQPYSLHWTGATYVATSTDAVIEGAYVRHLTLASVERNGSDVIVESGTIDPDTLYATLSVSRASDGTVLGTADMLIHNIYETE